MSVHAITWTLVTLIAIPACAAGADSADPGSGAPLLSFSGFGTLGVVHSSEDKADFTSSALKPRGAGYSRSWSPAVDSLIGAQIIATFTGKLSAVIQVIAGQNYDDSYRPHVEWANIKYQFTPDVSVRAGRIVLPAFFSSDVRSVGYANPWIRPPSEVYGLIPIAHSDGVDISYRFHIGDFTDTLQGSFGNANANFPSPQGVAEGRRLWTVSSTAEYEAWTLHFGFAETHLTVNYLGALLDPFRQFGPHGIALADEYNLQSKLIVTATIGALYDPGRWFMMGEWARFKSRSIFAVNTAWYVTAGCRLAAFTPYLTYAQVRTNRNSDPGLSLTGLPPNLAEYAAGLNAGLNSVLESNADQHTASVGLRWDFTKNVDLKVQFDHTKNGADSTGRLTNIQPGFRPGGEVNLSSVGFDFVF